MNITVIELDTHDKSLTLFSFCRKYDLISFVICLSNPWFMFHFKRAEKQSVYRRYTVLEIIVVKCRLNIIISKPSNP